MRADHQDRGPAQTADRLLHIDGLRAIAVMSVIGFHARISHMSGGFVGVDIFFVISGFVITRQMLAAIDEERFSAREFYAQRILRILPPLLLVCVVTVLCASFFPLLPREFKELYQSAAATAAMVSNYYFSSNAEYFSVKSEIQPLLHTWSLGVEEQYYLFAPWLILGIFALSIRRKWAPARTLTFFSIGVFVIFYVAAAVATNHDHRFAFYSVVTRAWQFAAGGTLATIVFRGATFPAASRSVAGALGAALVIGSVVWIDGRVPYPGTAALWPTLGAALLIISGIGAARSPLAKVLATPPLVAIGLVSYSWYLWHWPCLAFARSLDPIQENVWRNLGASALALALAVLTYLALERPMKKIRRSDWPRRRSGRLIAAGLAASSLVSVTTVGLSYDSRFRRQLSASAMGATSLPTIGCRSASNLPSGARGHVCVTDTGDKPTVLFWGDSHTYDEIAGWAAQAAGASAIVSSFPACPPLLQVDVVYFVNPAQCSERNRAVFKWLQTPDGSRIRGVVLTARWNFYDGTPSPGFAEGAVASLRSANESTARTYSEMLVQGLGGALKSFQDQDRRVLIVGPTPEFKHAAMDCMLRVEIYGQPRQTCAISRPLVDRRRREAIQVLQRLSAQFANVRLVDPIDAFCDARLCRPFDAGGMLFSDDNHLTPHGAERLYRRFEVDFQWVFGGPAAIPQAAADHQ